MLEENDITGIIKYAGYEKETKRSFRKETFNAENWKYDSGQPRRVGVFDEEFGGNLKTTCFLDCFVLEF